MLYINKITNAAYQQLNLTGLPGIQIGMTLRFLPRPASWVMDISYNETLIQGIGVVASLNLLRQFRNNIPFGISCIRADGLDPYQIDDFQLQRANLYLLDATDVAQIETDWFS